MKYLLCLLLISSHVFAGSEVKKYETAEVGSGNMGNGLKVTGKIVPLDGSIYIESARFSGRVSSVMVKEGDVIHPGKPLFLVNSAECLSLYQEKKMAKDRNLEDILKVVEAREKQLSIVVGETTCHVVASKGGVVTKKMVEAGSNFSSGDNLFTIINRELLTVELDVPERDANKVKIGQKVMVSRPSDSQTNYVSPVDAIIPSLNSVSRTVKVKLKNIKFKNNPSLEEFVFGVIATGEEGFLLKVPSASVVFSGDSDYVIKSEANGKLSIITVNIVNQADGYFLIREKNPNTLHIGDTVISKGAVFLFQAKFAKE